MTELYPIKYIDTIDMTEVLNMRMLCNEFCSELFRKSIENQILKFILKKPNTSNLICDFQMHFYRQNEQLLSNSLLKSIIDDLDILIK